MSKQLNIEQYLDKATDVKCLCGSDTFQEVVKCKKISKLLVGSPQDIIIPIPTLICSRCGVEIEASKI